MNGLKTTVLLAAMTALLAAFGYLLDRVLGTGGMMMALFFGLGIIMNWVSYFYSDKLVLRMYNAREVSPHEAPELHRMIDRLVAKSGLPKPKVCIIPTDIPNAFATGRNPRHAAVAATEGILRALSPEELEGVMAHELAHVKHRDTLTSTVAATIAGAIGMLANTTQWGLMFGMGGGHSDEEGGSPNPLFAVLLLIFSFVAPILAFLAQMAISRSREFAADRRAAELTGRPEYLASALTRLESFAMRHPAEVPAGTQHLFIVNPFSGHKAMALFSTHPPTEARVAALRRLQSEMASRGGRMGAVPPPPPPPLGARFRS